jgi:hypothetical protein
MQRITGIGAKPGHPPPPHRHRRIPALDHSRGQDAVANVDPAIACQPVDVQAGIDGI